jgi:3-hydroxyacyl-CoA dehydrogenase
MPVELSFSNGTAILTINNPRLNLISAEVRTGIQRCIAKALEIGATKLIVTGAGTTFVAGADAKEFGKPPANPQLNDVLWQLAHLPIPTIAAINGAALGGGLEIALACRYRIASTSAQLGLPEVTLGIVPGAGGTQRLPRLVGIEAALDLIATGKAISATQALEMGLIQLLADDPLGKAIALDGVILEATQAPDNLPAPMPNVAAADAARAQATRRMPGQNAPQVAVDLVVASATTPLPDVLVSERAAFLELRASDQARALRHVFFAERSATNKGRDYSQPSRDIASAIIVGGGNMGVAIAYTLATAGISATIVERDGVSAERACENLRNLIDQGVSRGHLSTDARKAVAERMSTVSGYGSLPSADLAIEAAFEDFSVKSAIFAELEDALPPETIIATNTSYLDVNRLSDGLKDPSRFVGLHFFSPAHIMKLLEIVGGNRTSDNTLGAAFALARRIGKIPVLSGVCDGFIGNRILSRYRQAANRLLVEGAMVDEVDAAMRGFGMAMGPYAAQDMSGLDIAYANIRRKAAADGNGRDHVPLLERLVEDHNRLGRKSGAGWYDYGPNGKPTPSDLVARQILSVAQEMNFTRRKFSGGEIVDRLILAMVAEACDILDEGIAEKPQDIDLVMIHGYGFPRWRGGLMHHAKSIGEDRLTALYLALVKED